MWDEETIRSHKKALEDNLAYLKEQHKKFPNDKSYENDIQLLVVRIIQVKMILQE